MKPNAAEPEPVIIPSGLVRKIGNIVSGQPGESGVPGVSIDSRTTKKHELFFAIEGERLDGHDFISQAVSNGATGLCVRRGWRKRNPDIGAAFVVEADDTLIALQELSRLHRESVDIPFIGITGSNGKTTTKEMLTFVLSDRHNVLSNEANQNNQFGVPLTLLRLTGEHSVGVIEMGADHPGDIAHLCRLVQPGHGLITNIGRAHLEFFKDIGTVAETKKELFVSLREGGTAYVNMDDPRVSAFRSIAGTAIGFGINNTKAEFLAELVSTDEKGCCRFRVNNGPEIRLQVPGVHNVYNALAAYCVARRFDLTEKGIGERLAAFKAFAGRNEIVTVGAVTIIDDTYNANPDSMRASIDLLAGTKTKGRRIAILGDMLELGQAAKSAHEEVGLYAAEKDVDKVYTFGQAASEIGNAARRSGIETRHFDSRRDLIDFAVTDITAGDVVLVKGSRSMLMEKVVEALKSTHR